MKAVAKGKRELNKEEKLRRIWTAAIDLFTSKGYDDTTTREIAKRAKVAMGTVFVYAETKRDLLFLVINDDLEACIGRARHALQADRLSLLESLLLILRIHYEYFARKPIISRVALREMYFYDWQTSRSVPPDARSIGRLAAGPRCQRHGREVNPFGGIGGLRL